VLERDPARLPGEVSQLQAALGVTRTSSD
jgi:hypothetical protein